MLYAQVGHRTVLRDGACTKFKPLVEPDTPSWTPQTKILEIPRLEYRNEPHPPRNKHPSTEHNQWHCASRKMGSRAPNGPRNVSPSKTLVPLPKSQKPPDLVTQMLRDVAPLLPPQMSQAYEVPRVMILLFHQHYEQHPSNSTDFRIWQHLKSAHKVKRCGKRGNVARQFVSLAF
jgi:hypothetical protein